MITYHRCFWMKAPIFYKHRRQEYVYKLKAVYICNVMHKIACQKNRRKGYISINHYTFNYYLIATLSQCICTAFFYTKTFWDNWYQLNTGLSHWFYLDNHYSTETCFFILFFIAMYIYKLKLFLKIINSLIIA